MNATQGDVQHTPGPWHCGELPVDDDRSGGTPAVFIWNEDETSFIASVCDEDGDGKATVANARLIAAAPEMLHALNEVMEDLACDGNVSDATMDLISAVIDKATK